jgi:hypothetical protein
MRVSTEATVSDMSDLGLEDDLFDLGAGAVIVGIEVIGGPVIDTNGRPVPGAALVVRADGKIVETVDASTGMIPTIRVTSPTFLRTANWTATIEAPGKVTIDAGVCNTSPYPEAWTLMACASKLYRLFAPGEQVVFNENVRKGAAFGAAITDYLIAQAITIVYGVGTQYVGNKLKNENAWRLILLGLAGTLGYTTYRAFDLAKKAGAADSMAFTVVGGTAGAFQGFLGLGALLASLVKIEVNDVGKQYTLVTKVKQMSRLVTAGV